MKDFIKLVEEKGNVYLSSLKTFDLKDMDSIIKRILYTCPTDTNYVYCSSFFLGFIRRLAGNNIVNHRPQHCSAQSFMVDLTLTRGSYVFHFIIKNDIKGAVIIPDIESWKCTSCGTENDFVSKEQLAKKSILIKE